jgi:hypothetical protein
MTWTLPLLNPARSADFSKFERGEEVCSEELSYTMIFNDSDLSEEAAAATQATQTRLIK